MQLNSIGISASRSRPGRLWPRKIVSGMWWRRAAMQLCFKSRAIMPPDLYSILILYSFQRRHFASSLCAVPEFYVRHLITMMKMRQKLRDDIKCTKYKSNPTGEPETDIMTGGRKQSNKITMLLDLFVRIF